MSSRRVLSLRIASLLTALSAVTGGVKEADSPLPNQSGVSLAQSASSTSSTAPGQSGISLAQTTSSAAATEENLIYDAQADFAKSWNSKKNPCGAWKYGWSEEVDGVFVLYTVANVCPLLNRLQNGWVDPNNNPSYSPSIQLNVGPAYSDGNVDYRHGALLMHGGGNGWDCYTHAIWTAPSDGVYYVDATFTAEQVRVNADAHILVKGVSCYSAPFTQDRDTGHYAQIYYFHAGDTVDFATGLNGEHTPHPGYVALEAVIQKLPLKAKALPDSTPIPAFKNNSNSV